MYRLAMFALVAYLLILMQVHHMVSMLYFVCCRLGVQASSC